MQKLAWVSLLDQTDLSCSAYFSTIVIPKLSDICDVHLFSPDTHAVMVDPSAESHLGNPEDLPYVFHDLQNLPQFITDNPNCVVLYNLEDASECRPLTFFSKIYPGITIFHDASLFAIELSRVDHGSNPSEFNGLTRSYYGADAAPLGDLLVLERPTSIFREFFPFLEATVKNLDACIVLEPHIGGQLERSGLKPRIVSLYQTSGRNLIIKDKSNVDKISKSNINLLVELRGVGSLASYQLYQHYYNATGAIVDYKPLRFTCRLVKHGKTIKLENIIPFLSNTIRCSDPCIDLILSPRSHETFGSGALRMEAAILNLPFFHQTSRTTPEGSRSSFSLNIEYSCNESLAKILEIFPVKNMPSSEIDIANFVSRLFETISSFPDMLRSPTQSIRQMKEYLISLEVKSKTMRSHYEEEMGIAKGSNNHSVGYGFLLGNPNE